jgi:hypothetical protein
MPEPRLYLYRKAGREVWDAEMWLPDGRRRVWRTGMVDRAEAEQAARTRLEGLLAPAMSEGTVALDAIAGAPAVSKGPEAQTQGMESAPAMVEAALLPFDARPSESGGQATPPDPASPAEPSWSERLDRWFFGELAALWR